MRMSAYSRTAALPQDEQVDLAVEVFRMLADATRVRLLWLLRRGESPVGDLADALDRPQALVSQHLAKLRMARLVTTRRQGSRVYYRLANPHVDQLVTDAIFNAEHAGPGVPAHHRET
jgi:DNA-binding transcriptional ArsR family regulator